MSAVYRSVNHATGVRGRVFGLRDVAIAAVGAAAMVAGGMSLGGYFGLGAAIAADAPAPAPVPADAPTGLMPG